MSRYALRVVTRAGGATLVAGIAARLIAPASAAEVAIAVAAAALAFELTRVHATFARRFDELEAELAQTQPLLALQRVLPTRAPLPAMHGYAIAPDCALLLAELVARERPRLVVETGSGVSTLVLAYALEKLGHDGRVIALDHDPRYAEATRALIRAHGLEAYATVVDAPLESIEIGGERHRWYATRVLADLDDIDLVLDDGPPRHVGPMLRYASLPVLAPRLSPHATFVLDVVGDEERGVLERWRHELPELQHEPLRTKKGNVLIRRARD
ncbi:MAG TPA: class I SAM-dependent methyltransferase [Kofleriaceae bacterium]